MLQADTKKPPKPKNSSLATDRHNSLAGILPTAEEEAAAFANRYPIAWK